MAITEIEGKAARVAVSESGSRTSFNWILFNSVDSVISVISASSVVKNNFRMKWFQQNRALGTLLIVSGVCILLGAALLYWRWSVWSDAKQTFDQAAAERNRLQRLDPFPDDANYRKLQGYLERYTAALDKFKDELKAKSPRSRRLRLTNSNRACARRPSPRRSGRARTT